MRRSCGASFARKLTVPPKFCFWINRQSPIGNYMIRFIYNLLWPLGLLFFLPGYFAKMIRRGGYREKFGQRVGIYDGEVRNRLLNQRSTWLHAVSVGEVNIALKLANALRVLEPG